MLRIAVRLGDPRSTGTHDHPVVPDAVPRRGTGGGISTGQIGSEAGFFLAKVGTAVVPRLLPRLGMSDKSFQIVMGIAVTALVVGMSTPLTGVGLQDLTTRLLSRISAARQAPATEGVAVARN